MAPGKEVRGVLSRKVSLFSDPGVCGSGVGGCWVLVKELELNLKLPEYGNPITSYISLLWQLKLDSLTRQVWGGGVIHVSCPSPSNNKLAGAACAHPNLHSRTVQGILPVS